ncbi:DUF502 domain-containing protein [Aquabacterium soli]|uniref:DUF502 domain-containing protein n=1 Tax=Aquabacterium soli TaxID=2493092 RepID=A0A3R8U158_9BURK|nr:DUF502 domain-containing protein [Aquabacterium soli]RRS02475.1 DUF502 domain-containing protein [Aquabacterium soli]
MSLNRPLRQLARTFLTGLLAALPLLATVAVFVWAMRLLYSWLGPHSFVGQLFVGLGLGLGGSEALGYLLGILFFAGAVFALGLLVQAELQRGLETAVNALVSRIPLVRNVYDLVRKFVDLLSQRDSDGLKSMSAVWCTFGGEGGVKVLGLLSTPEPIEMDGQLYFGVLVPTAPVPVGGGLLYVPQAWVTPADIGMDAVTSIYVSMGVTSAQHLRRPPVL